MKKKRKLKYGRAALVLCLGILSVVLICAGLARTAFILFSKPEASPDNPSQQASAQDDGSTEDQAEPVDTTPKTLHFNGVGDNLLHDPIFVYFEEDNGSRDYLPIYEMTLDYSQNADLAYINFETLCAGDAFGLSGYPNFNGPVEMMDTLKQAGYDWFSVSSNHSFDRGVDGIMYEMNYLDEHMPEITYTGSYTSEEKSHEPVVREINGIKVGLASFTYGLNGYVLPEDYTWLVDQFLNLDGTVNYPLIDERLDALEEVSDVQIVSMHWGNEYETVNNALQTEVAEYLHEKGVEVIIGSHPHVIQPAEIMKGENQDTLIYYSLGNFLSSQNQQATMVGGMADFDLVYHPDTKTTTFENVKFIPTVTWISGDIRTYRTMTLPDYNNDWAAGHYLAGSTDMSKEGLTAYVQSVMGEPEGIQIVYE